MKVESYKNLIVWQKAMELVIAAYKLTGHFPKEEIYGLTSQMKRSAISIPSNIAEGSRRGSRKDFRHFLLMAFGSGAELETQLETAKRLSLGRDSDYFEPAALLSETMRMLNKMCGDFKQ